MRVSCAWWRLILSLSPPRSRAEERDRKGCWSGDAISEHPQWSERTRKPFLCQTSLKKQCCSGFRRRACRCPPTRGVHPVLIRKFLESWRDARDGAPLRAWPDLASHLACKKVYSFWLQPPRDTLTGAGHVTGTRAKRSRGPQRLAHLHSGESLARRKL